MNNVMPEKLLKAIQEDNLILFIGAGCSLSHGLPTWKDLVKEILLKLDEKYSESANVSFKNLNSNIDKGSLSLFEALNKIEAEKNEYVKEAKQIVYEKINSLSINESKSDIHNLFWNISKKIVTTNYDKVLEKYRPNIDEIKIFDNNNSFLAFKSQSQESQFLYKIHGDYENPDSLILFESDYKKIYNSDDHNYDTLSSFFKGKTLLFIGFSLTDPFVNNLFLNVKKIYGGFSLNNHYIFTTNGDDFSEFDINSIKIDNWNESLISYLNNLVKSKSIYPIIENSFDEKEEFQDFNQLNELIKSKITDLQKNPSDSKLNLELNDLRSKIDELFFNEIDYLQQIPEYRNNELRTLFDSIYSSEKIDRNLLDRIYNVRTNHELYNWYDRSVILSAITCSLIHFNKVDEQKISIIIDFINDNENKVWQKAITSLFMVLNHLGNKWLRFQSIKNKLEIIKKNPQLQESCFMIIQLFTIGYHNFSFLSEKVFENEYFKENPFNYFLPFFENDNNSGYVPIFDNYKGNIDEFLVFLNESKMPDQIKYLLCNTNSEEFESKDDQDELDKKTEKVFTNLLRVNHLYYPYSVHVHEIIHFYKFLPKNHHDFKLKYQLEITETPIKEYLLNEVEKGKALASHFMKQKNWSQAIVNLIKADGLSKDNVEILQNLAQCYCNKKEYRNETIIRDRIDKIDSNNLQNLEGFYYLYNRDGKNANCLEIANKLIDLDANKALHYGLRAQSNEELGNFDSAIIDYNKAISLNSKSHTYYHNCSNVYLFIKKYDDALEYIKKAESLGHEKAAIFNSYSNFYRLQGNFEKALKYIEKAIKSDKVKDYALLGTKAVIYASMGNDDEFFKIIEKVFQNKISPKQLYPDIKEKYKENLRFIELLDKYNLSV